MITSIKMYSAWMYSLLSGEIIWGKTPLTVFCASYAWSPASPVTYLYGVSTNYNKHTIPESSQYVRYNGTLRRTELCVTYLPISYTVPISQSGMRVIVGQEIQSEINSLVVRPLFEIGLDFSANPIAANEVVYVVPSDGVLAHYTGDTYD